MIKTLTIAALSALGLIALSSPAFAEDGAWRIGNDQIHVVQNGLDLSTVAGRAQLLAQVERAARTLCNERPGAFRDCEAEIVRDAIAANKGRTGHALAMAVAERDPVTLARR